MLRAPCCSVRVSTLFWELLPHYFSRHTKVPEAEFKSPDQADDIGIFLLFR